MQHMIDHRKIVDYSDLIGSYGPYDIPLDIIDEIHDQIYVDGIRRHDRKYLDELKAQIEADGLEKPGLLELHLNGIITLQDGNHRYIVHKELGLETYRVQLNLVKWSPSKTGIDISDIKDRLWEYAPEALEKHYE